MTISKLLPIIIIGLLLTACNNEQNQDDKTTDERRQNQTPTALTFSWDLPAHIAPPITPSNNPMSEPKIKLGRFLFYDLRLSGNQTQSCASCHQQVNAFADEKVKAIGSTGEVHPRNSQSLVNIAFNSSLTWNNSMIIDLEKQITMPLFGQHPVELDVHETNRVEVLARLTQDSNYQKLFDSAFPNESSTINFNNIIKALASFVRTLNSYNSPFDQFEAGNKTALSNSAQRGMTLFFSERLACSECHNGQNFNQFKNNSNTQTIANFHNVGLYNLDGLGKYPNDNTGLIQFTHKPEDMGKFKTPTLRNVEHSAPYMHDGSLATLEDVVDFYSAGGRVIVSGEFTGDGRTNPFKQPLIKGFALDNQDKKDLVSFLKSLSDNDFLHNPNLSNPFITATAP